MTLRRMLRDLGFAALILMALLCVPICQSQTPVSVQPCDLVKDAAKYNKRLVQVRGRISLAFEDFTLVTDGCDSPRSRWVWLAYGGDEPTPTMSTVNDQARKPGSAPKLDGKPLLLRKDESLDLFRKRLVAQRIGRPDGQACWDRQCYLYDVTATITGTFLAANQDRPLGGYGHLGCCHLLVIQAVEAVDAQRTQVPAGGRFECSKDVWKLDASTAIGFQPRRCHDLKDCDLAATEQLSKVAEHWKDAISVGAGTVHGTSWGRPTWQSNDLKKSYSLVLNSQDASKRDERISTGEATRTICRAIDTPYPQDVPVACRNLWSEFPVTKEDALAARKKTDAGQDIWRMRSADEASKTALEEAARKWDLKLVPGLTFGDCSKPMVVIGDQFTWCRWSDSNSMQAMSVQLTRFGYLRRAGKWETAPWILTRADGVACAPDQPERH